MTRLALLVVAVFIAGVANTSQAGNPQRGLEISEVCQACHGRYGDMAIDDETPILAGQHQDYLVHALKAYRDGSRQNAIMQGFAQGLSDRDIRDLAAWYSRQEGLVDLSTRR